MSHIHQKLSKKKLVEDQPRTPVSQEIKRTFSPIHDYEPVYEVTISDHDEPTFYETVQQYVPSFEEELSLLMAAEQQEMAQVDVPTLPQVVQQSPIISAISIADETSSIALIEKPEITSIPQPQQSKPQQQQEESVESASMMKEAPSTMGFSTIIDHHQMVASDDNIDSLGSLEDTLLKIQNIGGSLDNSVIMEKEDEENQEPEEEEEFRNEDDDDDQEDEEDIDNTTTIGTISNSSGTPQKYQWTPLRRRLYFNIHTRGTLADQDFTCYGCQKDISGLFTSSRYCEYSGRYYCSGCHNKSYSYIPGRILTNWDFKQYQVAKFQHEFLKSIDREAMFDVASINPKLYKNAILLRIRNLRRQMVHIREFLGSCITGGGAALLDMVGSSDYLCHEVDFFSLYDLVNYKQLLETLRGIVAKWLNHVEFDRRKVNAADRRIFSRSY
eukprot:gene4286-5005_t